MGLTRAKSESVTFKLNGTGNNNEHILENVKTVKNLELPTQTLEKQALEQYQYLNDVNYANYSYAKPTILIGQDKWDLIVSREIRHGKRDAPVASRTKLGWIIHGYLSTAVEKRIKESEQSCNAYSVDCSLYNLVKESFRVDALGVDRRERENVLTKRAIQLLETYTHRKNARWETALLWNNDSPSLPDSRNNALNRLKKLEKKLDSDEAYANLYYGQMENLIKSNYAEMVINPNEKENTTWYLPHFGVRSQSKPNKLRLVFDAAVKVNGVSLNDNLLAGPDLLNSLFGILMRFRQKRIGIVGDIKEMFLQIKIRQKDQAAQQFLWRGRDRVKEPTTYRMTSMIFGAKSSPCTATYVLRQNAAEYRNKFPRAVEAVHRRHYVDDYLDSTDTIKEAIDLINQVSHIHKLGGFIIRGWVTNNKEVLDALPGCITEQTIDLNFEGQTLNKTLGLQWNSHSDQFIFNIKQHVSSVRSIFGRDKITKRQMLKIIMSLYDPIGFLAPFTVKSKILLQDVWRSGVQWDEDLRSQEYVKWREWVAVLETLSEVAIPRCYNVRANDKSEIELHCFCDASEQAYATVIYWRFLHTDGSVEVVFVTSKNRVAPLKPLSVPRLELQAAVLGCRLAKTVVEEHSFTIKNRIFWTDSRTVLCWIRSDPRTFKPFVSYRLGEIDELSDIAEWRWVPSGHNPADEATRDGCPDLRLGERWFAGPSFLAEMEDRWPKEDRSEVPQCTEERRATCMTTNDEVNDFLPDERRFSSWIKLIRTTARILLFIDKCRKVPSSAEGISSNLIKKAEELWIRNTQCRSFKREMEAIKHNKSLPRESRIKRLTPILDPQGILRVGSRTAEAPEIPELIKFPVILDGRDYLTKLLVQYQHERIGHGSTEIVINELRQKYWVVRLRPTVKNIIYACPVCRITKAKASTPRMGNLPPARMAHHRRPFTCTGLDYFGPLQVTVGRHREKRWGVLFTCLTTRAVHLEIATTLTTDSAIMALRRMAARRGTPAELYSDNATNFRGADTELREALKSLDTKKYQDYVAIQGIAWHFIPPSAPHMGGSWERLIRSVKRSLKITLKERAPHDEVLATLFAEAEHTVNSRPLTYVSVESEDQEALTPNHFLIGSSSGGVPPGSFSDDDLCLKKKWRVAQRLADHFWNRWIREYFPSLHPRHCWQKDAPSLRIGDIVIVVDHTLPRNVWPRGQIANIYPGKDGRVRVVSVRTATGVLFRPARKIIKLPIKE